MCFKLLTISILLGVVAMGMFEWLRSGEKADPQKRLPLSDEQLREMPKDALVNELNRQILEPLQSPPPGFSSKQSFVESDISARVRKIDWFSQCGKPIAVKLLMPIRQVSGWKEAYKLCKTDEWENVELEAQNQLTIWLHNNSRDEYQNWNDLVIQHKTSTITPVVQPAILAFCRSHDLGEAVLHSVQWDILGALMENSYLNTGHKAFFFLELLAVYEAGHFPCGWEGEWPDGRLCIW